MHQSQCLYSFFIGNDWRSWSRRRWWSQSGGISTNHEKDQSLLSWSQNSRCIFCKLYQLFYSSQYFIIFVLLLHRNKIFLDNIYWYFLVVFLLFLRMEIYLNKNKIFLKNLRSEAKMPNSNFSTVFRNESPLR